MKKLVPARQQAISQVTNGTLGGEVFVEGLEVIVEAGHKLQQHCSNVQHPLLFLPEQEALHPIGPKETFKPI